MEIDFKFNVCNKRRFTARRVITRAPALLLIPVREKPRLYQKRLSRLVASRNYLIAEYHPSPRYIDKPVAAISVAYPDSAHSAHIFHLCNSLRRHSNNIGNIRDCYFSMLSYFTFFNALFCEIISAFENKTIKKCWQFL